MTPAEQDTAEMPGDDDADAWLYAPYVVLRVAGLPTRCIVDLPGARIAAAAAELRTDDARLREAAGALADRLHDEAPRMPNDAARRQVIGCKRDAHNLRRLRLDAMAAMLPPDAIKLLDLYREAHARHGMLEERFAAAVRADLAGTRTLLAQVATDAPFRQGLSLASPALTAQLDRRDLSPRQQKQVETSLLAYMLRAAAKISPFSTFTVLNLLPLLQREGESTHAGGRYVVHRETALNRSLAVALRQALGTPARVAEGRVPLVLNATLRFDDAGRVSGNFRAYEERRGGLWSEEHDLDLVLPPAQVAALRALPPRFGWTDLIAALAAAAMDDDPVRVARKLLRKDVVRLAVQWGAHEPLPMSRLADALGEAHPERAAALRAMDAEALRIADLPAGERGAGAARIMATFRDAYRDVAPNPPPQIRTPVLEDAWGEGLAPPLGPDFLTNSVRRAGLVVARRASLSIEYLWLRRHFLQRFGAGGHYGDVHSFLAQAWQPFMAFSQAIATGAGSRLPADAADGIDPAALRLPISLYFQSCAESEEEAARGLPRIVLNGAYNRIGWQLARATSADTPAAAERALHMRRWLEEAAGGRLVTFSVSGEASNLQMHRRLADAHLCFDQQPRGEGDLTLHDIGLHHDPASGLVGIVDARGAPIHLQYLGSASNMPSWGLKHLLITLAEPVQIGRPATSLVLAGDDDGDIRHQDRLEEDGCVIIRRTWWLRASYLRDRWRGLDADGVHRRLLDILHDNDIPLHAFVSGQFNDYFSWRSFGGDKLRKPVFCRFTNPMCMTAVASLVQDADWLVVREAVPHPRASWLAVKGSAHVAEIHAEMVVAGGHLARNWVTNWRNAA